MNRKQANLYSVKQLPGFTLVETLVSISLLLLVVVGPLTITIRTARSASFASEQVVAHFLAQEGIELAEKIRDDAILEYQECLFTVGSGCAAAPWARFTSTVASGPSMGPYRHCYGSSGCGLEITSLGQVATPRNCATTGACRLWGRPGSSGNRAQFTHDDSLSGIEQTPYTRTIRFTEVSSDEIRIVSEVTWRTGSLLATQRVRVETTLFNVYDIN